VITGQDVAEAGRRIAGRVRRTGVVEVDLAEYGASGRSLFKLEFMQHTGSFKPRGMLNRLLAARETDALSPAGVVCASGGNAGLAAAYAAREIGVPIEVYVPRTAPPVKIARLADLGATVVKHGEEYAQAHDAALKRVADTGALYCHAYDQPEVVAGQGTLGLELWEQAGGIDTVLVAVGGGGLSSGIAAALKGRARVVGVEPDRCPTLHAALEAGHPVDVSVGGVAADALGARRLGEIAYQVAVDAGMGSVLVDDRAIVEARRLLWQRWRLLVEYGAAAALAALTAGTYRPEPGERVAVVLCGANTDPADLAS
jgi:threonine dehydratase